MLILHVLVHLSFLNEHKFIYHKCIIKFMNKHVTFYMLILTKPNVPYGTLKGNIT